MPASPSARFLLFALFAVVLVLLLAAPSAAQQKNGSTAASSDQPTAKAKVVANYGHLPLNFEANRGQTDSSVQFLSRGLGYTLFLRRSEAMLALRSPKVTAPKTGLAASMGDPRHRFASKNEDVETSIVRMKLVGANSRAAVREEDELVTRTNYFLGNDPSRWLTNIPNFGRVRYSDVYPGVDLVYYGNQGRLEHDFIVSPGADPARIRLAVNGAKELRIDPIAGALIVSTNGGELRFLKPISYQDSNGHRTPVSSTYRLLDNNEARFDVANYDHSRPLVIDPVLVYSTYLGGSGDGLGHGDQGNAIAVDHSGDAYIVGTTNSVDFPVTAGAFSTHNKSAIAKTGGTVFVSKFNELGTALVFSTFLGGSGGDYGYGVALDSTNAPYITGATNSQDFPLTCGAIQLANGAEEESGATTAFVTKLSVAGNRLMYSTFFGGTGTHTTPGLGEVAQAIAVDAANNAYIAGYTYSADFPTTKGAFQTHFEGEAALPNAFVAKINSQGAEAVYSTLLGGNGGDFANAIALDAQDDAFVAGSTGSKNFPVTSGAFQTVSRGSQSAFVMELNPSGSDTLFSTYLSGGRSDSAQAIAVDAKGFTYVAGATSSEDFPLTSGSLEGTGSRVGDFLKYIGPAGFATKLNQDGSALKYSTFLEGYGTSVQGLAVDNTGTAYLTGTVVYPNAGSLGVFKATPEALATPGSHAQESGFLVKLNPAATVLNYATLVGGNGNDSAMALALDSSGNVYVTGSADSANFPVSANAFQSSNKASSSGASNAFVSKFSLAEEIYQTHYPAITSTLIPTVTSASCGIMVDTCDNGNGYGIYDVCYQVGMSPVISNGPTPTGELQLGGDLDGEIYQSPYSEFNCWNQVSTSSWPVTCTVEADYSGDSVYAPSSDSGSDTEGQNCSQPTGNVRPLRPGPILRNQIPPHALLPDRAAAFRANMIFRLKPDTTGPKFIPPTETNTASSQMSEGTGGRPEATTCKSPLPQLTVTILPAQASRAYGAGNPQFSYHVAGLLNGDRVNVTIEPGPSEKTPVGTYRIAATVSGTSVANYELVMNSAALTITPETLTATVLPKSASSVYGSPVPNFTYSISGARNQDQFTFTLNPYTGDKNSVGEYTITGVVSGAAVGNYQITVIPATLNITPAVITAWPSDVYGMTDTIFIDEVLNSENWVPSGFVNGDHYNNAYTGRPTFWSSVPPTSPPGSYTIFGGQGTLSAHNYTFRFETGVLNLFAPIDAGSINAGSIAGYQFKFKYGLINPVGGVAVLTGGNPGVAFSDAALSRDKADQTYTASFEFTPPQPGAWSGSFEILRYKTNEPLISIPISGNAVGPLAVFDQGPISVIQPGGTLTLEQPIGVAVSEGGVLYIADAAAKQLLRVDNGIASALSINTTLVTLTNFTAIATDVSGDLLVAETGKDQGNLFFHPLNAGWGTLFPNKLASAGAHGIAFDALGNSYYYLSDTGNNRVLRISNGDQSVVLSTGSLTLSSPSGLAVDVVGNLFIADTGNNRIVEVAADGTASIVPTGTPALNAPTGIAVDSSGTLYISETGNNSIVAVSPSGVQTTLLGSGLSSPQGIALDSSGEVYVADTGNKQVVVLQRDLTPSLSYANTQVGAVSTDSPKTVTFRNVGNSSLTISSVSYPQDFPEDTSGKPTDCMAGQVLVSAASCTLTVDFKPVAPITGASALLKESVKVISNTLNNPGTVQTVSVQGTELK